MGRSRRPEGTFGALGRPPLPGWAIWTHARCWLVHPALPPPALDAPLGWDSAEPPSPALSWGGSWGLGRTALSGNAVVILSDRSGAWCLRTPARRAGRGWTHTLGCAWTRARGPPRLPGHCWSTMLPRAAVRGLMGQPCGPSSIHSVHLFLGTWEWGAGLCVSKKAKGWRVEVPSPRVGPSPGTCLTRPVDGSDPVPGPSVMGHGLPRASAPQGGSRGVSGWGRQP